jgi:hypothetical protein
VIANLHRQARSGAIDESPLAADLVRALKGTAARRAP